MSIRRTLVAMVVMAVLLSVLTASGGSRADRDLMVECSPSVVLAHDWVEFEFTLENVGSRTLDIHGIALSMIFDPDHVTFAYLDGWEGPLPPGEKMTVWSEAIPIGSDPGNCWCELCIKAGADSDPITITEEFQFEISVEEPSEFTVSMVIQRSSANPRSMHFIPVVLGEAKPATYIWDFGDGMTSIYGGSVSHSYDDRGTYTVSLTVFDALGNQRTYVTQIEVEGTSTIFGMDHEEIGKLASFGSLGILALLLVIPRKRKGSED